MRAAAIVGHNESTQKHRGYIASMSGLDWLMIALYFGLLLGLTWWSVLRNRNTADDYFLASRDLGWVVVGASIFASNIGSEHLVGLAGAGATSGVALAHYELHAWCLLVLGWVLVPFYLRSRVYTMPEFLERRYSATARWVLSLISLVAYVLTKMAVGIFAGGVVFGTLLPEMQLQVGGTVFNSFWIGSVLVVVLTGLYTIVGGMRAVAYTEAVQTAVLVLGSLLLTVFGLSRLGGWDELRTVIGSEMFNLWKPLTPAGVEGTWLPVKETGRMAWYFNQDYPWFGMLFCAPIVGLWYWCTDQYIVQRTLGAPNEREARRGTIFAAFLKLLPVFIFIVPGMIALALARYGPGAGARCPGGRRRQRRAIDCAGLVSAARAARDAKRVARCRRGRAVGRSHELARRCVQRLVHALHLSTSTGSSVPTPRKHSWSGSGASRRQPWSSSRSCGFRSFKVREDSTSTSRASRRTWRRRSPRYSSSASS